MVIKHGSTSRRKRAEIDPKTLKKSTSSSTFYHQLSISGNRERTSTGFTIRGFVGTKLETLVETFLPGTTSAVLLNAEKERVVRVLSGSGFLILFDEQLAPKSEKKVMAGDEFAIPTGTAYKLATASGSALEVLYLQEKSYSDTLVSLQETDTPIVVSDEVLVPAVRYSGESEPVRDRTSKAAEQLRALTESKRNRVAEPAPANVPTGVTAVPMHNVRPSMGRFTEEDAG